LAQVEPSDGTAVAELCLTGRERHAIGIEKAAAVAGDAVDVGDHDAGALPGDLDGAQQLGRIRGYDLVENDACGHVAELRIAGDPAAEWRLRRAAAVVEDQAVPVDVELVVLVTADD